MTSTSTSTLIDVHSEKEGAAGTFKRGFGFHPLLAYLDGSREALAGVLRPGNTAADHVEIVELVLEALPRAVVQDAEIVVRTDSAAATHEFTDELRATRVRFLMGYDLTAGVRDAILGLPESAWRPAIRQDGTEREGARRSRRSRAHLPRSAPKHAKRPAHHTTRPTAHAGHPPPA